MIVTISAQTVLTFMLYIGIAVGGYFGLNYLISKIEK